MGDPIPSYFDILRKWFKQIKPILKRIGAVLIIGFLYFTIPFQLGLFTTFYIFYRYFQWERDREKYNILVEVLRFLNRFYVYLFK